MKQEREARTILPAAASGERAGRRRGGRGWASGGGDKSFVAERRFYRSVFRATWSRLERRIRRDGSLVGSYPSVLRIRVLAVTSGPWPTQGECGRVRQAGPEVLLDWAE
jgi:hypothetical protein